MTIQSPLLTLLLLAALTLCGAATFRWNVFVEPDANTRAMFMLRDGVKVKSDSLTTLARIGWFIGGLVVLYILGRVQGFIL